MYFGPILRVSSLSTYRCSERLFGCRNMYLYIRSFSSLPYSYAPAFYSRSRHIWPARHAALFRVILSSEIGSFLILWNFSIRISNNLDYVSVFMQEKWDKAYEHVTDWLGNDLKTWKSLNRPTFKMQFLQNECPQWIVTGSTRTDAQAQQDQGSVGMLPPRLRSFFV